jgi:hypothetical protein
MCTVTFIPRKRGYLVAMNRDEKRSRPAAIPPAERMIDGQLVSCPSEPGGGTWIAVSDRGVTLSLINWYSVTARARGKIISRGEIIPAVMNTGPAIVDSRLAALPLARMNPFRLIGIFSHTNEITEWRWDLKKLQRKYHRWRSQQWISSGFDEPAAQKVRSRIYRRFKSHCSVGTSSWLRRLHGSHLPEPGPFSTCMHRHDAQTVSYTEISVTPHHASIHYQSGPLCLKSPMSTRRLVKAADF